MTTAESSSSDFIHWLSDRDAVLVLGLAANVFGVIQGIQAFVSLFQESDTDRILGAINQLREDLDRDFRELGDLIRQQIQVAVDTTNRDTMALALSDSDAAADGIQNFLANNDSQALENAINDSIRGVSFFIELGLTSPDLPFFIPGIVKAGTIRLFVIAAESIGVREAPSVVISDVSQMITSLATMIRSAKRTVNAAHYVATFQHSIACPPLPQSPVPVGEPNRIVNVIDGYAHYERVAPPPSPPPDVRLQFFDAQRGHRPACEQPSGLNEKLWPPPRRHEVRESSMSWPFWASPAMNRFFSHGSIF